MQEKQQLPWLRSLLCLIVTFPLGAYAQDACQPIAEIISAQGEIRINGVVIDNVSASRDRLTVCAGDLVSSGDLSRASLAILYTDAVIRIDQNTEFRINPQSQREPSLLELIKGAINFLSPSPVDIDIKTAAVNASVEGTEFHVRVDGDEATITVIEGDVRLTDSGGGNPLLVERDQAATARTGQAPAIDPTINSTNIADAVQWAQFYPLILNIDPRAPATSGTDIDSRIRRAAVEIDRGQIAEAEATLAAASPMDPSNEAIWGLRLITELGRLERVRKSGGSSQKDQAIARLLDDPIAENLSSSAALVGLSYAQQQKFDLEGARASLETANANDPGNPIVLARLAEVWLAFGDTRRASQFATEAAAGAPNGRASSVLGFVRLAELRFDDAEAAFLSAIGASSVDPLPHLGLGLVHIRRGDLDLGLQRFTAALGQGQAPALIYSYLGKLYYEMRETPEDENNFIIAQQTDRNDPTPWFYDAIRLQTVNEPIRALESLHESIEKNDNRAVFRSRLLLDQDLAARSASLGRIFVDLGFEQSALVQGWTSVNADPSDFSGHRFLADTYSVLPRHEVARVSELLQSQLLQPTNITPIQPQLAETSFFILSGAGPSEIGFNEFNPIFARDGLRFQANAIVGGDSTSGNDLVLSGIVGRYSFSLGQYRYTTDGSRENNDQERRIYNAFGQAEISANSSVQIEYRKADSETGDIGFLFDSDLFSPNARNEDESEFGRLGFRHRFAPGSDLIGNISYGDASLEYEDSSFDPQLGFGATTQIIERNRGWNAELQHIFRRERWRLVTGVGAVEVDRERDFRSVLSFPFPPFIFPIDEFSESTLSQENFYAYAMIDQTERLTWTLGVSANFYEEELFDRDQWNPKFGVNWRVGANTTLRAAAFRTLTRPLIANQTIEPTQVAGFNQFFDGIEGEEARRYGVAIDQRFSRRLYGGIEYSQRDLSVPIELAPLLPQDPPTVEFDDWEEQIGRAYLHWTPTDLFAIGIDYLFEDFERRGTGGVERIIDLETQRLPVTLSYFHPRGMSGRLTATYVDQVGEFARLIPLEGEDSFIVVDAALSFRFPNRFGLISLIAKNLFDEDFQFQGTDPTNPKVLANRLILLRLSLSY